jgi:hypothetical protein
LKTKITFFPVDNGDMTLIRLADNSATSLLIDVKIRNAADDDSEDTFDVAAALRMKLKKDAYGRPFVDGFMLSHPDLDHCSGFKKHFWLGDLNDYPDDTLPLEERRIVIRELWFSPIVFKRKSDSHNLVEDAQAFNTEAKRRIGVNKINGFVAEGDRIRIIGEGENGETEGLEKVLYRRGDCFTGVNAKGHQFLKGKVLAPFSLQETDSDEETLSKNNSSIIINFELMPNELSEIGMKFLTGGDAEVGIWEKINENYVAEDLEYDLLLAPHHCSWRTISEMSWSDYGEDATVSISARRALANAKDGAIIVASSKLITDEDTDPPCIRAKREYESILSGKDGVFYCTGDYPTAKNLFPLTIAVTSAGLVDVAVSASAAETITSQTAPRAGSNAR